ncbi:MAG: HXXEE domain-containing protein [Thermoanaerobaculia bacterium]
MPLRRLVLLSPVVFTLHALEEFPGFVAWFNSLVPRGITRRAFLAVNAVALAITLCVALLIAARPGPAPALLLAAWVGFLMLANGLLHLVGTIALARYAPGVVTGTLLYLPYGAILLRKIVRELGLKPGVVAGTAAAAGVPMLVHGYLILFRASRLF